MNLGEAGGVLEFAINLVFMTELGTTGAVLFKFYGNFFPVRPDAQVDVAKGAATDSFGDAVFGDGGLHFYLVSFYFNLSEDIARGTELLRPAEPLSDYDVVAGSPSRRDGVLL